MIIRIKLKPNAKASALEELADGTYKAQVRSPALENKANLELIKLLSKYFGVSRSQIKIIRGLKGREKVVEIRGNEQ